jgi:CRP-like cAMP-binding protein
MDNLFFAENAGNQVLGALAADADAAFLRALRPVRLAQRSFMSHSGEVVRDVYFPLRGAVSAVRLLPDGSTVEVATIGSEGMTGPSLYRARQSSEFDVVCQTDCEALCVSAAAFLDAKATSPAFRLRVDCYAHAFLTQVAQIAACNTTHRVLQRTCLWLLVATDRYGNSPLPITQEFIASMLGVRRAGVTVSLHELQDQGLVSVRRGHISVLDRSAVEHEACACYTARRNTIRNVFANAVVQ